MKDSFLSKLRGSIPDAILDEQGVCRAEDVGRPEIDASATTPCACALRRNAPASTSRARARRLPQQVSARARVHIAKAPGASLTEPGVSYPRTRPARPGTVAATPWRLRARYTPPATTIPTSQLRSAPPSNRVEMGPWRAGTRPSSTVQPAIRPATNAAIPAQLTSP